MTCMDPRQLNLFVLKVGGLLLTRVSSSEVTRQEKQGVQAIPFLQSCVCDHFLLTTVGLKGLCLGWGG